MQAGWVKELIVERLSAYPRLSATRLFEEVRKAGYVGGYSQLKVYVRSVRPQPAPEPVQRFETPPGLQAQVDFAEFRLPWGVRYALVVVLGYSRLLWFKFYPRQTMAVLMAGLEEAFAAFGGVPRELLFDQLKAVIVEDERMSGGKLLENAQFQRFAAHWGFRIRACRPYRARTKGKVERPIGYVRQAFFYGREFVSDADLNGQSMTWQAQTANRRLHRTVPDTSGIARHLLERAAATHQFFGLEEAATGDLTLVGVRQWRVESPLEIGLPVILLVVPRSMPTAHPSKVCRARVSRSSSKTVVAVIARHLTWPVNGKGCVSRTQTERVDPTVCRWARTLHKFFEIAVQADGRESTSPSGARGATSARSRNFPVDRAE